jgi:hypothetical protein
MIVMFNQSEVLIFLKALESLSYVVNLSVQTNSGIEMALNFSKIAS